MAPGDRCDAHTSLPEKWILRRHICSLGLRVAEVYPQLPSSMPRVQLVERKADLDDEIVIQKARNDLCRCEWEGADDGAARIRPSRAIWSAVGSTMMCLMTRSMPAHRTAAVRPSSGQLVLPAKPSPSERFRTASGETYRPSKHMMCNGNL